MARRAARHATAEQTLQPQRRQCWHCGRPTRIAYRTRRSVTTLRGVVRLHLTVRRCGEAACPAYHRPYRPEAEGTWALPKGETGLDVIALVGALRSAEHRSVPEIHRHLTQCGVRLAERTVTNLLHRYEELVAIHVADRTCLRRRLADQGQVILAVDGLQPDVGHEVLWVLRDCLSGAVLLARSLLSGREEDLAELVRDVVAAIPVPIRGVISDGQHPIRKAVRAVLPDVPHHLCHFHYLREAAKPVYEADRHAKKELKKRVRGVRPIERALEGCDDPDAAATRGYCLAVRSALTDDGRPPRCASGLKLRERLRAIQDSIARVMSQRGGLPRELAQLDRLLGRGLSQTADLWPAVETAYGWVHRAAHLLANHDELDGDGVCRQYEALLAEMRRDREAAGTLAPTVDHFLKVTASYWPGLFHCYDVADLPRTNNDLEHFFASVRYHERRANGRRSASPGTVVRGSVRLVAAVATRLHGFTAADLTPAEVAEWRKLRRELEERHEERRAQRRFRRDPAAYLSALEQRLAEKRLPP